MVSGNVFFGKDSAIVRDRYFQLLIAGNATAATITVLLSPLLGSLTTVYGVSEASIGLLITVATVPGIVIIPLMGMIADQYGRKPVLVGGLLLFGLAGGALSLTADFRLTLLLRFLQGIGWAGTIPVIIVLIGDIYDGTAEVTAQGLRFTASGVMQAIVPVVAGGLIVVSWQYPFLLFLVSVPLALSIYFGLEDDRLPSTDQPSGVKTGSRREYLRSLIRFVTRPAVLPLIAGRATLTFLYFAFLTYVSIVVVNLLGETPQQAGFLLAVASLVYATAASQSGRALGWISDRRRLLVAGHLALGAGIVLLGVAPGIPVAVVGVVCIGVGWGLSLALYRSVFTTIADPEYRGGVVTISESAGRTAASIAPIALGVLIHYATVAVGFELAVRSVIIAVGVLGGGFGAIAVLLAWRLGADERIG